MIVDNIATKKIAMIQDFLSGCFKITRTAAKNSQETRTTIKKPVTTAQYQVVMLLKFVVTMIPKGYYPPVLGIKSRQ